ncbi:hypothetical protein NEOLEDRAFT_1153750 [Neolentinus lepideus HHB14362 ss-1]|uniref:Fungal-type protein kinase domain-containing protein n=1 Tax=Neolentinus lepideus HHB14362 ss-1 TaxID=1314782 RepID=A0A165VMI8_9AGAM|nr:hypothetical protein NEOLEDRAFT_1153750 [Neolentinus lepideus HHB14362 ss-1]
MANLICSSKSGNDWGPNDLVAYNIRIVHQDFATFFGVPDSPVLHVDDEFLTAQDAAAARRDAPFLLLRIMEFAMATVPGEESAVDNFAVELFKALHYIGRDVGRIVRTRKDLPFWVCGEERHVQTDVCVMDSTAILLLIQEDKRHMDRTDPEPQLVAETIAAFYNNNQTRMQTLDQAPVASKVIPGITMKETVLYSHYPVVPRPACRYAEGMKPLDNRRVILACYEVFKQCL